MKNLSLYLQFVIIAALGYLYYLHFSKSSGNMDLLLSPNVTGETNAVYVNIDTLLEHYTLFQTKKGEFEKQQANVESEINKRKTTLETEYANAQARARGGQMTEQEMGALEEKLMQKQQELMEFKQQMEEQMVESNTAMTKEVFLKLQNFLHEMNKKTNYQFIFGYTREGGILLANDSLNITNFVIEGLNKEQE